MSEANKAVVRRLFDECLNRHNPDLYSELYCDVVYRAPALGELRNEEHRHFLLSLFAGFPDAQWAIEDQVTEEDKVVTRWTCSGTHTGTFLGISPTGRQLRISGICIDRILGGKIVEEWEEWDTLGMMQQLALLPREVSLASSSSSPSTIADEWDSFARI
jgi:steroid delta-isomerase-like uncharacterized protein